MTCAPHRTTPLRWSRLQAANLQGVALLRIDFDGGHDINDLSKAVADAESADDYVIVLAMTATV